MIKKKVDKKVKTSCPGVYRNPSNGKYYVKFCYTEIDIFTGYKEYRQKWYSGFTSFADAKKKLALLKSGEGILSKYNKEFSLSDAYELWIEKAKADKHSSASFNNTRNQYNVICNFWNPQIPIMSIREYHYYDLINQCREYGYSEDTIYNINSCLRKLINIAYQNRYIEKNPLDYWDTPRINPGAKREVITPEEFRLLDQYMLYNSFVRCGDDCYPMHRFMLNILYYTGMRIGEAVALNYNDFIECKTRGRGARTCYKVSVTKSYKSKYDEFGSTKNFKIREIPIPNKVFYMYKEILSQHLDDGGSIDDRIFESSHSTYNYILISTCKKVGIPSHSCHDFRHTYISNLIRNGVPISVVEAVSGDVQETIFKHYSHMFKGDENMVLEVLEGME